MIRVVLVDDERLALERLKRVLLRLEGIEVIGAFTSSRQAIGHIFDLRPDVAFLDIEMPGLNGLEAAEEIRAVDENIDVVFVTGFDRYAVNEVEPYAVDCLLKPVSEEMLQKTVRHIIARRGAAVEREESGE